MTLIWPLLARFAAPLIGVAALLLAVWAYGHRQYVAGKTDERATYAAAAIEAERENARIERHRFRIAQEVQDAYAARSARDRAAAAAARAELGGLLDATAASVAAASDSCPASGADAASDLGDVFRSCASSIQTLAEHADATETRLSALQAWVRGVLVGK